MTILIYIGTSTKSKEKITYKLNFEYQNGGIPICGLKFSSCPNEVTIENTEGEEFKFVICN